MEKKLLNITAKIIEYSYYLLFFLVPLILTPFNYELFEFNKMLLTYAVTVIITGSWTIKMITQRKFQVTRTPLDVPLLLFLLSQVISTFFSIDRHVSIWGYYSRFNGGLLSTISYTLLYFAFVTNFPKEKIRKLLLFVLSSGILVSIYGILEHFGLDKNIWVQDVQNRVFSTLGQPNWLAAYLAVLIPITVGLSLNHSKLKNANSLSFNIPYLLLSGLFFLTLIYTKSRSGFLGLIISLFIFWLLHYYIYKKTILKYFLIFNSLFLILIFLLGAPIQKINPYTLPEILKSKNRADSQKEQKPLGSSIIDVGITESGVIRNIVWKGAINIFKNHPLIGSGTETFAFSYFKFRPVEHNMTSEWDFLYNKAHNEYLNYAANTGILGLGSYLLIIGTFIILSVTRIFNFLFSIFNQLSNFKFSKNKNSFQISNLEFKIIYIALFSAWFSILITNFFGFSVVIIQLFFFLIPAILFQSTSSSTSDENQKPATNFPKLDQGQKVLIIATSLSGILLLFRIGIIWLADFYFAKGQQLSRSQEFAKAYQNISTAITLNKNEPLYLDELSYPAAQIALYLLSEDQADESAQFLEQAIATNQRALEISPKNVNFWKTKTRVLYALTTIAESYLTPAIEALEKAKELSPTDPKIRYNLALMYDQTNQKEKAYQELLETIKLKIDYKDAYLAQAVFYAQDKKIEKAKEALNFILTRINPTDEDAKKQLEELK